MLITTERNAMVAERLTQCQLDVASDRDRYQGSGSCSSPWVLSTSLGGIIDVAGGAGHVSLALSL